MSAKLHPALHWLSLERFTFCERLWFCFKTRSLCFLMRYVYFPYRNPLFHFPVRILLCWELSRLFQTIGCYFPAKVTYNLKASINCVAEDTSKKMKLSQFLFLGLLVSTFPISTKATPLPSFTFTRRAIRRNRLFFLKPLRKTLQC